MGFVLNKEGEEARPLRIAVAIPSHDMCMASFAYDLGQMMLYSGIALPDNAEIGITLVTGTYIHQARQELLAHMLGTGVTHALWLDSDMRFPKETLVHLLKRDKDIVGANYPHRAFPPGYVAIKRGGWHKKDDLGEKCVTTMESSGLDSVDAIGFGCVLTRLGPLHALPKDEPWFWYEMVFGDRHVGEDVYFCRLVKEKLGLEIFVDHDLSKECAHIGQFEFNIGHAQAIHEEKEEH